MSARRLPSISMSDARKLLGPLADQLHKPADIAAAEAATTTTPAGK